MCDGGVAVCVWVCVVHSTQSNLKIRLWIGFEFGFHSASPRAIIVRPLAFPLLARRHDRLHAVIYTDVCVWVCVSVSIHMHIRRALLIPRASFDKRAAKSRNLQNLCVHTCLCSQCECVYCVYSVCVFLVVINALRDSCDLWDCWGLCVSQQFVRQMDTFRLIAAKWFK